MEFLFLAGVFLIFALIPYSCAVSGRVIAIYGAVNCMSYYLYVSDIGGTDQSGIIGRLADLDASIFTGYGATALLVLGISIFMLYFNRKYISVENNNQGLINIPKKFSYPIVVYSTIVGLLIVYSLGIGTIISYEGYGKIKDVNVIYGDNSFIKVIVGLSRPAVIFTIMVAIFSWRKGARRVSFLSMPAILIGFLIGISASSRIVAVYFAIASICFYLTKKQIAAAASVILIVLSISFSSEARGYNDQGLLNAPKYLISSLQNPDYFETVFKSVAGSLQVTSAAINSGVPDGYSLQYKLLSFSPSFSAIDNFQDVKRQEEQRIGAYIPFSAFAEAWLFGSVYFSAFAAVLFVSAYCVNSSVKFGKIYFVVLFGAFIIGLVYASQYPLRNTVRYFYILIAMWFAIRHFHARKLRSRWLDRRTYRSGPRRGPTRR